jgi:glycosyltransferase involved in cell wall biosynthesis
MKQRFVFTIFTPAFNSTNTIERVYESLNDQTYKDFEWLVIDDGSMDGTGELIRYWQENGSIRIRYFFQENQGKHIAFNQAVNLAMGEFFLPLDHDDACVPGALERLFLHWRQIPTHLRIGFSGVTCLCQNEKGEVIGNRFPDGVLDSDELEMKHRYRVFGEKWGFHRTSILKEFPFPEIPNVGYVSEGIVWNAIALKYKKRFINEPLRIYYSNPEQLSVKVKLNPIDHSFGRRLYHKMNLNECINWLFYDPIDFIKSAINYSRFSFHRGINLINQWNELSNWKAKLLWALSMPVGCVFYIVDKKSSNKNGR